MVRISALRSMLRILLSLSTRCFKVIYHEKLPLLTNRSLASLHSRDGSGQSSAGST